MSFMDLDQEKKEIQNDGDCLLKTFITKMFTNNLTEYFVNYNEEKNK